MRKTLFTILAVLALASPAFAWQRVAKTFHVHNNTVTTLIGYPIMVITGIAFNGTPFHPLPDVASGQSADFPAFSEDPCLVWVTIYPKFGIIPPITATNQFNRCTQSHIAVVNIGQPPAPLTGANFKFTYY